MKTSDARNSLIVVACAAALGLAAAATLASAAPTSGRATAAASPCPSSSSSPSKPPPSGLTTIIPTSLPTGGGSSASTSKSPSATATKAPAPAGKVAPNATGSESASASATSTGTSSASAPPSSCQPGGSTQKVKSTITIESHRHLHFSGVVRSSEKGCFRKRHVVLKKVHAGKDPAEGTDITNRHGDWIIVAETKTGGGKYYAVATKKVLQISKGKQTICKPARSDTVRAR